MSSLVPFKINKVGISKSTESWAWWNTLVIPALARLRQEHPCEFKANLNHIVRHCGKKPAENLHRICIHQWLLFTMGKNKKHHGPVKAELGN